MVRVKETDTYEKLDVIIKELCDKFNLTLYVEGWSRKSYRIYNEGDKKSRNKVLFVTVESLAVRSGVITYHDDDAMEFCLELGKKMEDVFELEEAILKRDRH